MKVQPGKTQAYVERAERRRDKAVYLPPTRQDLRAVFDSWGVERLPDELVAQLGLGVEAVGRWSLQGTENPYLSSIRGMSSDRNEIVARQGAFRELMFTEVEGKPLATVVRGWLKDHDELYWAMASFRSPTDQKFRAVDFILYDSPAALAALRAPTSDETQANGKAGVMGDLARLLDKVAGVDALLAGVQSERLKALRWSAQSVTHPEHPRSLSELNRLLHSPGPVHQKAAAVADALESEELCAQLREVKYLFDVLDFYQAMAHYARDRGYETFPTVLSQETEGKPFLRIQEGHLPSFARSNRSVPNSLELGGESPERGVVLTGPNNQGKSTYVRMVAQLVRLAQLGLPVPAKEMTLTPLQFRAHVDIADNLVRGEGLFKAEARSLGSILKDAQQDPFTLVLLDEMMPGTTETVRKAVENAFLAEGLGKTEALSIVATHNLTATEVGAAPPFKNQHVEAFHVLPGPVESTDALFDAARKILAQTGWPEHVLAAVDQGHVDWK